MKITRPCDCYCCYLHYSHSLCAKLPVFGVGKHNHTLLSSSLSSLCSLLLVRCRKDNKHPINCHIITIVVLLRVCYVYVGPSITQDQSSSPDCRGSPNKLRSNSFVMTNLGRQRDSRSISTKDLQTNSIELKMFSFGPSHRDRSERESKGNSIN